MRGKSSAVSEGGGSKAIVTGRVGSQEIIVYGETDNGITKFDYSTDYNVPLGSMLACIASTYGSGTPSGLEDAGNESLRGGTIFFFKVTGDFVIYSL